MSLEKFFQKDNGIKEKIKQRRSQMLIHSCIYYELNDCIVSDQQWQDWAEELHILQKEHPEYLKIGFYDYIFNDWDGTTGAHLPYRTDWVYNKALFILQYHKNNIYN